MNEIDLKHLNRCIELAAKALSEGDQPFGSVLVSGSGDILYEDHNHTLSTGDRTQHPEFNIARWAAANLTPEERAKAKVYTSGEHCPMCAAAHAWVGLGPIFYAGSSKQLTLWRKEFNVPASPVNPIPIQEIAPGIEVNGPVEELAEKIKKLHREFYKIQ